MKPITRAATATQEDRRYYYSYDQLVAESDDVEMYAQKQGNKMTNDAFNFIVKNDIEALETQSFFINNWRPGNMALCDESYNIRAGLDDVLKFFEGLGGTISIVTLADSQYANRTAILMAGERFSGRIHFVKKIVNGDTKVRLNIMYAVMDYDVFVDLYSTFNKKNDSDVHYVFITEHYMKLPEKKPLVISHEMQSTVFSGIYSELYPGINIDKMLDCYLESQETLLILVGRPGCGKTSLVKKIIEHGANAKDSSVHCCYVKDKEILHSSQFWSDAIEAEYDYLILDDLDQELVPRTETMKTGEDSIVNSLLSFTNGIFPVQTKVIITTNLTDSSIDSALIRPGRCFDVIEFPFMTQDFALNLWINKFELPEASFVQTFEGLEEITQSHFMSEVMRFKQNDSSTYLTDPSISVRNKYVNSGKKPSIGFVR